MNSADRTRAIMFVWLGFGIAAAFSFAGNAATSVNDIFLALVFAVAAVLATGMVMSFGGSAEHATTQSLDKVKRYRLDVDDIVDSLDDEELRALRQRLMSDSDTAVPLQNLVSRQQNQSQK